MSTAAAVRRASCRDGGGEGWGNRLPWYTKAKYSRERVYQTGGKRSGGAGERRIGRTGVEV